MRIEGRKLLLLILAITLFAVGGCSEDITGPMAESQGDDTLAKETSVVTVDGVTTYEGVFGGSCLYALLVPDDWNGELVVYAHGFVDAGEPLTLPTKDNAPEIRDRLVSMGFAWGYCSYRENGLAIKDGVWSTRKLTKIFKSTMKESPAYTWLMGHSLGGLIGVDLVEKHPGEYDGLVTLSGMIGGTAAQLDYVGNVRILFDLFYPGVLPGTVIDVPEDYDFMVDVAGPVVGAVTGDPNGLGAISMLTQTPLPGRDGNELVESLVTAIGFNYRGIHDLLDRTGGACPIDNFDTIYTPVVPGYLPDEVLQMINDYAQRYDRSIPTDFFFERHYEPSGALTIPMIAVHNQYDPVVPLFNVELYAAKVADMGFGYNLELRVIERYGHTDFPAEEAADEAADALMDLRASVQGGGVLALAQ